MESQLQAEQGQCGARGSRGGVPEESQRPQETQGPPSPLCPMAPLSLSAPRPLAPAPFRGSAAQHPLARTALLLVRGAGRDSPPPFTCSVPWIWPRCLGSTPGWAHHSQAKAHEQGTPLPEQGRPRQERASGVSRPSRVLSQDSISLSEVSELPLAPPRLPTVPGLPLPQFWAGAPEPGVFDLGHTRYYNRIRPSTAPAAVLRRTQALAKATLKLPQVSQGFPTGPPAGFSG